MINNIKFNDVFFKYYKITKTESLEKYDFNILLKEFLRNLDILENQKISAKLNLIDRSINIIQNQYYKMKNYTNRAVVGINKCYLIINTNKEKIEDTYIEIFYLINNEINLKTLFMENIVSLFNNIIINNNNNNILSKSNEIVDYTKIINLNKIKEDNYWINIEKNKYFLKKENIYFIKYKNINFLIKLIKILFLKTIRHSYLKYKKISRNIKNELKMINLLKIENNSNNSKIIKNEKAIEIIKIEYQKNKSNLQIIKNNLNIASKFELKNQYVYLISNDESIYKIGKTNSIENRLKQLNTSHWNDFKIIKLFQCENMTKVENYLHEYYDENRINANREFFKLDIDQISMMENVLKTKFGKRILKLNI